MDIAPFRKKCYGSPKRGVIFYFCGWRTPIWLYRPVFLVANLAGYRVHAYAIEEEYLANSDSRRFLRQVEHIFEDVSADIVGSEAQGVSFFASFGNSLGSEIALACAKNFTQVKVVVLNTVRGSTSDFLWRSPYAAAYRNAYEAQGYTEAQLYREFKLVEATEGLSKLGKRPVLLYYSKVDETIPPRNTKLLITAMAAQRIKHKVFINKYLGHFWGSAKNHLFFWRWLGFLRDAEKRHRTHS